MTYPSYQQTMTPVEQVQRVVNQRLSNLNTILPCKVVSVNYPKVTVQPLIQRGYQDEQQNIYYLPFGNIPNIPVLTLGNNMFNITFPQPQPDDVGLFLVNQSNVSQVYNSGENINTRKFDMLDGVYIPLFMQPSASTDTLTINAPKLDIAGTTDFSITAPETEINSSTSVTVNTPNFSIKSPTAPLKFAVQGPVYELLASIVLALTTIKTANTVSGGPFDPASQTAIQAAITQIQTFI